MGLSLRFWLRKTSSSAVSESDRHKPKIHHQLAHTIDARHKVYDFVLIRNRIESLDSIIDGLAENSGQADTHRRLQDVSNKEYCYE